MNVLAPGTQEQQVTTTLVIVPPLPPPLNDKPSMPIDAPVEIPPAPTIPIYAIALSPELQQYTYDMCVQYNVSEHYELVLALMWQESSFKADTISSTNDYGLMQINESNHGWLRKKFGDIDFLNAEQNIQAGVYMLSDYLLSYTNENQALMAYHYGIRGASKYWKQNIFTCDYTCSIMTKKAKLIL